MRHRSTGFTMIELMIVVSIVAILSAIAVPNYMQYLIQSRRSEAYSALLDIQSRMQNCYSLNQVYCLYNTGTTPPSMQYSTFPYTTAAGYYDISLNTTLAGGNVVNYTAIATANSVGAQRSDTDCQSISLTDQNLRYGKGSTDSTNVLNKCWK